MSSSKVLILKYFNSETPSRQHPEALRVVNQHRGFETTSDCPSIKTFKHGKSLLNKKTGG